MTLTAEALGEHLIQRLEDAVIATSVAYDQLTVTVAPEAYPTAARLCKEDSALAFDFFDFLAGVDERDQGFGVVTHLYSVRHRHHVTLRAIAEGGRDEPHLPTLTGIYRGADWHERETYDMFGIVFDGHPGLLPRLLTVENFEGWPLRKEFLLSSREVKPWPGAKEPEEAPAVGAAAHGAAPAAAADAPPVDRAAAAQAKAERAKAKAAEMRRQKAAERAAELAEEPAAVDEARGQVPADVEAPQEPAEAAAAAETDIAADAAAGAVQGDTAAGAPGDVKGSDEPTVDPQAEAAAAEGGPPSASGVPGVEIEGAHADPGRAGGQAAAAAGEEPGEPPEPVTEEPEHPQDEEEKGP